MSFGFGSHRSRANPSPYSPHERRFIDQQHQQDLADYMQGYYEPPKPEGVAQSVYNLAESKQLEGGNRPSPNMVREFGNMMLDAKRLALQGAQARAQYAQQAANDKIQLSRMYTNSLQNGQQLNPLYGPAIARRLFGF